MLPDDEYFAARTAQLSLIVPFPFPFPASPRRLFSCLFLFTHRLHILVFGYIIFQGGQLFTQSHSPRSKK